MMPYQQSAPMAPSAFQPPGALMLPQTSLSSEEMVDGANNEEEDAVVPGQEELSSEELAEIEKQAKREAEDVE